MLPRVLQYYRLPEFIPVEAAKRAMYYIRAKGLPPTRETWDLLYPSVRQECRMQFEAMVKSGEIGRVEGVHYVPCGTT